MSGMYRHFVFLEIGVYEKGEEKIDKTFGRV